MKKSVFLAIALCAGLYLLPALYAQDQTPPAAPAADAPRTDQTPRPNVPADQAVPVQQVPSPASPQHVPDQVMWALAASYALQYLKNSSWFPFITPETTRRVQAQIGFMVSLATAAGVHFAVTGNVLDGNGASVTITGLSIDAFKDIIGQWVFQQGWYDGLVRGRLADTHQPKKSSTVTV